MINVTEARAEFREIIDRVAHHGERIVINRYDKPAAGIVPIEDLELLEALEDKIDIDAARKALKKGKFIPWGKVKKDLGL